MTFPNLLPPLTLNRLFPWRRTATSASALFLALLLPALPGRLRAAGEQAFGSPDEALKALIAAAANHDTTALHAIFGPEGHDLVSPDVVQATAEFQRFVQRLQEKTRLNTDSDSRVTLELGADAWPFPIPLVQQDGHWFFDTKAGRAEILNRRVGMDELGAIDVCHAYVEAQREYASQDRLGDGVLAYAQFLHSTPDQHDGLFWPAKPGETLSPLGPLVAAARVEGYPRAAKMLNDEQAPYHGYFFKILTRQGPHASGGARDYIVGGRMTGGFALLAYPAKWGDSGIVSFMVNQNGIVFENNLGPDTATLARQITQFDPDLSWNTP